MLRRAFRERMLQAACASASLLSGSKEAGELEVVAVLLAVDANARCGLAGLWLAGCVVHSREPGWLGD